MPKQLEMIVSIGRRAKSAFHGVQGKVAAGVVGLSVAGSASAVIDPRAEALKTDVEEHVNFFIDWGYELTGLIVISLLVWAWMRKTGRLAK